MFSHCLTRPRLLIKKQIKNKEIWQRDDEEATQTSDQSLKINQGFKKYHRNACRTKVTQLLEKRFQIN